MTKYIPIVDLDATQKYFDLLAIAAIESKRSGNFTFKFQSPREFLQIIYLQAYDDAWESFDEIRVTRETSFDSLSDAEKMLLTMVFKVTS